MASGCFSDRRYPTLLYYAIAADADTLVRQTPASDISGEVQLVFPSHAGRGATSLYISACAVTGGHSVFVWGRVETLDSVALVFPREIKPFCFTSVSNSFIRT